MSANRRFILTILVLCVLVGLRVTSRAQESSDKELVKLVLGLLEDEDQDMRALALEQVRGGATGEEATRQFAAYLSQLNPDGQLGLIRALADRGDRAAWPAVLQLLDGGAQEAIRVAVIGTAVQLGSADDVPWLIHRLSDGEAAESEAARSALRRMAGESVTEAVTAALSNASPSDAVALIDVLAARRARSAVPRILVLATASDPAVRRSAMAALGNLGGPDQLAGMVHGVLIAEPGAERADAEKAILAVCRRIENRQERALPILVVFDKLERDAQLTLLPTLGRVGGPDALHAIEKEIASRDSKEHSAGIRAISNWPDASIASRLIELAKTDLHAAHQTTALRALIRVAVLKDARSDGERLDLLQLAMPMCRRDQERMLVLQRARAVRTPESLRFVLPYVDVPKLSEDACETIVELAHHRGLREPNKAEFHRALDKVIQTSHNATTVDRARRYKNNQTWVRPKR